MRRSNLPRAKTPIAESLGRAQKGKHGVSQSSNSLTLGPVGIVLGNANCVHRLGFGYLILPKATGQSAQFAHVCKSEECLLNVPTGADFHEVLTEDPTVRVGSRGIFYRVAPAS